MQIRVDEIGVQPQGAVNFLNLHNFFGLYNTVGVCSSDQSHTDRRLLVRASLFQLSQQQGHVWWNDQEPRKIRPEAPLFMVGQTGDRPGLAIKVLPL